MSGITFDLPEELVDAITERVLERIADRLPRDGAATGWLRGADAIARYLNCPRSRIYTLSSERTRGCPIRHDGAVLIAKPAELDEWLVNGGSV
jgi:hypothetical protein